MADIPLGILFGLLFLLLLFSAFFSGSETALMALNRYRMRHKAQSGHRGAQLAARLLDRPDRLIGLILLGNNLVNILITQIATFVGWRLFGDAGIAITTGLLTLTLLIFAETAPKTLGALHSERIAYPAAWVYSILLKLLAPLVFVINLLANGLLRLLGIPVEARQRASLTLDELRSVVDEARGLSPSHHHGMLLNLLDLDRTTVEDIMIPRSDIVALDLHDDWNDVHERILTSGYTRLPIIEGDLDHVLGFVHVRDLLPLVSREDFGPEVLKPVLAPPYFIPEGTSLSQQLVHFQTRKRRIGLVVDEFGDIEGLVTLEDLLEEVIGKFTTDSPTMTDAWVRQPDGSALIDGSIHLRELNRTMGLQLPVDGPKTLSGLIVEYLEDFPEGNACVRIGGHILETVQLKNNTVRTVRMPYPPASPHGHNR